MLLGRDTVVSKSFPRVLADKALGSVAKPLRGIRGRMVRINPISPSPSLYLYSSISVQILSDIEMNKIYVTDTDKILVFVKRN